MATGKTVSQVMPGSSSVCRLGSPKGLLVPKRCYEKAVPMSITEPNPAVLMFESAILATPEAIGGTLGAAQQPGIFPIPAPRDDR